MADKLVLQGLEVVGNRESFVTDFKHSAGLFAFLPALDFRNNPSRPCSLPRLAFFNLVYAYGSNRINDIDTVQVSARQAAFMSEHEAAKDLIFTFGRRFNKLYLIYSYQLKTVNQTP